jgi:hypothetical protein
LYCILCCFCQLASWLLTRYFNKHESLLFCILWLQVITKLRVLAPAEINLHYLGRHFIHWPIKSSPVTYTKYYHCLCAARSVPKDDLM